MKIRKGYISNSSSTSFVIKPNDVELAKQHKFKLYKVSDIIEYLKPLYEANKLIKKLKEDYNEDIIPYYMNEDINEINVWHLNALDELEEKHPGCYISSAQCRDWAYINEIKFDVFDEEI